MHVMSIVTELLKNTIHKTRIKSLIPVLQAIIGTKTLSLTQLGRSLPIVGKERAGIRRVDRLLANSYYQNNSIKIYQSITENVIKAQKYPDIIVDWTGLPNSRRTADAGEHYCLRASLATEGRSITLYEEVHPKAKEGNSEVHRQFLETLKSLLPDDCKPCILTDAGFKNPWFQAVIHLGWNYIGCVRGVVHCDDGNGFKPLSHFFEKAGPPPKYLGNYTLAKKNSLKLHMHLYNHPLKGRKKITKGKRAATDKDSKAFSRGFREPWVLVSSYGGIENSRKVVNKYKKRMTIELSFRDTKNKEFGLSLNENKTVKAERYIVWLLLAALASLIAWIIGYAAEKMNCHFDFQANTYKHRRVLSFFYLGCQVIRKGIVDIPFSIADIRTEA